MRLLALFGLAGALFAQSPAGIKIRDEKPATEWIVSPDPLKQAWAAHWIAEEQLTALIPELLRVVESPETSADADAARFAALDTLIQLNAQVPLSDLEPLVDRFPTDVLILAARSGDDATALLLKLLDRQHNREAFVAVGNLLTPRRVPGFAAAAMKEFCQRATVYVYNPGQPRGAGGAFAGDSFREPDPSRTEWPETGSYRLVESAKPMPHAVSFIREASQGYVDHGFDFSSEDSGNNSCLRAEQFLATYLDTQPSQLPIRSQAKLDLNWTTDQAFEASVRGFIAEQRQRYAVLAAQLAARGYLTADQASKARLNLRISADNMREHDWTPLPDIGEWAKEPPP
jgi:hypothetical protein